MSIDFDLNLSLPSLSPLNSPHLLSPAVAKAEKGQDSAEKQDVVVHTSEEGSAAVSTPLRSPSSGIDDYNVESARGWSTRELSVLQLLGSLPEDMELGDELARAQDELKRTKFTFVETRAKQIFLDEISKRLTLEGIERDLADAEKEREKKKGVTKAVRAKNDGIRAQLKDKTRQVLMRREDLENRRAALRSKAGSFKDMKESLGDRRLSSFKSSVEEHVDSIRRLQEEKEEVEREVEEVKEKNEDTKEKLEAMRERAATLRERREQRQAVIEASKGKRENLERLKLLNQLCTSLSGVHFEAFADGIAIVQVLKRATDDEAESMWFRFELALDNTSGGVVSVRALDKGMDRAVKDEAVKTALKKHDLRLVLAALTQVIA